MRDSKMMEKLNRFRKVLSNLTDFQKQIIEELEVGKATGLKILIGELIHNKEDYQDFYWNYFHFANKPLFFALCDYKDAKAG